jgi:hypothetical protein
VTETDPDTLEIDEDAQEIIRDNIQSIDLEARVENHLPFGVEVMLFFDDVRGDSTLYAPGITPDLTVGPLVLEPASTGPDPQNPGYEVATVATESVLSVNLEKEEIRLFENERVFQGTRITVLGTDGVMVRVRASDYLRIRANLSVGVRTKIPEDEDGEGGGA